MKRLLSLALVATLGLAACETATPYQPRSDGNGGYSDQKLEANRYRVSFSGNTSTPRDVVENYLLYRAAEVTVQQGYDWFDMANRNTQQKDQTVTYVDPVTGHYIPITRYYGNGNYRTYLIWQPDPFSGGVDRQTYQRFTASAEILMHHGTKPEGDTLAFNAHEVMDNLGPTIKFPDGAPH